MFLCGFLTIIAMQTILYPLLNREVIPVSRATLFPSNMCVISSDSWDAMEVKVLNPLSDVRVSVPNNPFSCADGSRAVLVIPDGQGDEMLLSRQVASKGYLRKDEWEIYRRHLTFFQVVDYLKGGQPITTHAQYYEH